MTAFDEVWLKAADVDLAGVPVSGRDQIEALVRQICRNPYETGVPRQSARPDIMGRDLVATAGPAVVFYRVVDENDRIVYIVRVAWRA